MLSNISVQQFWYKTLEWMRRNVVKTLQALSFKGSSLNRYSSVNFPHLQTHTHPRRGQTCSRVRGIHRFPLPPLPSPPRSPSWSCGTDSWLACNQSDRRKRSRQEARAAERRVQGLPASSHVRCRLSPTAWTKILPPVTSVSHTCTLFCLTYPQSIHQSQIFITWMGRMRMRHVEAQRKCPLPSGTRVLCLSLLISFFECVNSTGVLAH